MKPGSHNNFNNLLEGAKIRLLFTNIYNDYMPSKFKASQGYEDKDI